MNIETCTLCHDSGPTQPHRNGDLCDSCYQGAIYYDNLTPEERIEDDLAIAQYCHEAEYEEAGEIPPPGPMDLYTVEEWGQLYRRPTRKGGAR